MFALPRAPFAILRWRAPLELKSKPRHRARSLPTPAHSGPDQVTAAKPGTSAPINDNWWVSPSRPGSRPKDPAAAGRPGPVGLTHQGKRDEDVDAARERFRVNLQKVTERRGIEGNSEVEMNLRQKAMQTILREAAENRKKYSLSSADKGEKVDEARPAANDDQTGPTPSRVMRALRSSRKRREQHSKSNAESGNI